MDTINAIDTLRTTLKNWRQADNKIAFVPTMGNLHDGHLSLVKLAKQHADKVVVSIFVNPLQFGPQEDFATYPKTIADDQQKLAALQVDTLFLPTIETIYPHDLIEQTFVEVPGISKDLCGASRPGFFRGIATIVNKLFNIVQPDVAIFGEKDYQQLLVIKKMVVDLSLPIEILSGPIIREANGLAMSSRNNYLSAVDKDKATLLYQTLSRVQQSILTGNTDYHELCQQGLDKLAQQGFHTDYLSVRRQKDLQTPSTNDKNLIVLGAVYLGKTRLIDNICFSRS